MTTPVQQDEATKTREGLAALWHNMSPAYFDGLTAEAEQQYFDHLTAFIYASEPGGTSLSPLEVSRRALLNYRAITKIRQSRRFYTAAIDPEVEHSILPVLESETKEQHENNRIREENKSLKMQIELLKSRVADLRATQTREIQRFDQLQSQNAKLAETNDKLVTLLSDRDKTTNAVLCQMAAERDGRIRIRECYQGVVEYSENDTAVVIYTLEGKPVEHVYERRQFLSSQLPPVGTPLKALAFVLDSTPQLPHDTDEGSNTSDEPSHRKPLSGPEEF